MFRNLLALAAAVTTLTAAPAFATWYQVNGATLSIYAQSNVDGGAHLLGSSKGIYNGGAHPWCGNRAYIDLNDKELFSTALAATLAKRPVNFYYEDAAPTKMVMGHTTTSCRITSIWF